MTLLEWLTLGDVGVSSKTMCAVLVGTIPNGARKGWDFDVPHDPSDFERCLKFVNVCNLQSYHLLLVKKEIPWFAPFIDNWDKLVELRNKEAPSGTCPKLYKLMQELEDQSKILDGWEKTSPNCWERTW